jgi:hypothetical protein
MDEHMYLMDEHMHLMDEYIVVYESMHASYG